MLLYCKKWMVYSQKTLKKCYTAVTQGSRSAKVVYSQKKCYTAVTQGSRSAEWNWIGINFKLTSEVSDSESLAGQLELELSHYQCCNLSCRGPGPQAGSRSLVVTVTQKSPPGHWHWQVVTSPSAEVLGLDTHWQDTLRDAHWQDTLH